jgi:methyl-accepting chemotaxis protein
MNKDPAQLLKEVLEVGETASAYVQEVRRLHREIVEMNANVEQHAETVANLKDSIEAAELNVTTLARQVNEYADELTLVADNIDAIEAIGEHSDVLNVIATDLQGYPIQAFDGGNITDPNDPLNGMTGGVMKHCSDNMEAIRRVAELFESGVDIHEIVSLIDEIGSTDYVAINRTGISGA